MKKISKIYKVKKYINNDVEHYTKGKQKEIPELQELQDAALFIKLFIFVTVLGIIISWISTYLAVRKYLKIKTDFLYYH